MKIITNKVIKSFLQFLIQMRLMCKSFKYIQHSYCIYNLQSLKQLDRMKNLIKL